VQDDLSSLKKYQFNSTRGIFCKAGKKNGAFTLPFQKRSWCSDSGIVLSFYRFSFCFARAKKKGNKQSEALK
jgi:hypothetical protein